MRGGLAHHYPASDIGSFGEHVIAAIRDLQLAAPRFHRLIRLSAKAPVLVAETGCREPSAGENRSKAAWLQALFDEDRLTRLTNVNFFSSKKNTTGGSTRQSRFYKRHGATPCPVPLSGGVQHPQRAGPHLASKRAE